jgi:hypothetical protein
VSGLKTESIQIRWNENADMVEELHKPWECSTGVKLRSRDFLRLSEGLNVDNNVIYNTFEY